MKRQFGSVRKLPSGRWQARYEAGDGSTRTAPSTFETKREADGFLAGVQTDMARGSWKDPLKVADTFLSYAESYIEAGAARGLAPRTVENYRGSVRNHLQHWHAVPLDKITPAAVRAWHTSKAATTGSTALRNAYALLRSVMNQAIADELIERNPCRVRDAGTAKAPERPLMAVDDFLRLYEAHSADMRPLLSLTFGASLRLGELCGLRRGDLDLDAGTLRVERQVVPTTGGETIAPTKTKQARTVHVLADALEDVREYLAGRPAMLPTAPLFVRDDGRPISRSTVDRAFVRAREETGLTHFHFHDLRHASLTLAAQSGASIRELMARGGHATSRAALIYSHASSERDAVVAAKASESFTLRRAL
ncbi:tyrosine recombinase XerC [Rathayibacter sp. AY1E9]|uniref:site-specific integrase n=1 Tax=Rathayibacter sp. AY1E9 TaxID=2080556 RepID=UPI0015E222FC|nr:tyrosine-type recombinase/integrase [Rathayibacter sp. AY1E9]